jgi:hypothetical protein
VQPSTESVTMYETIARIHAEAHEQFDSAYSVERGEGGQIRGKRGKLVERLVDVLWRSQGEDCHTTTEKYSLLNSAKTHSRVLHLDCSLWRGDVLAAMVECKAYLDFAFLQRTDWNASLLRRNGFTAPLAVVTLEKALAEESAQFVLGDGNLDHIFYLCAGRRDHLRPMYDKRWFKPIEEESYKNLNRWMTACYRGVDS